MAATGTDFISLQVRDLERSCCLLRAVPGPEALPRGPPVRGWFDTKPIALAVRDVAPGTDLYVIAQPGQGMALWLHAPDAQDIHDALAAAGTTIVSAPVDGPFGRTFTFADPDGYQVTLHDRGGRAGSRAGWLEGSVMVQQGLNAPSPPAPGGCAPAGPAVG